MAPKKNWIATVTSDVLHFKKGIFACDNPRKIALELRRSSEASPLTKRSKYASAMSMLCYYINRSGKNLDKKQKKVLENAKIELKKLYGRD